MSYSFKAIVLYGGGLLQVKGDFFEISYVQTEFGKAHCEACALRKICDSNLELRNICIDLDGIALYTKSCMFKRYEGILPPKKTLVVLDKMLKEELNV